MTRLGLCVSAGVLVLSVIPAAVLSPRAQEARALTPFLGETAAEFEARRKGLPRPSSVAAPYSVTVAADPSGHFVVESTIDGIRVRMLVDTGASFVALAEADARRIGIDPSKLDYRARASTANGVVSVAPVVLKEIVVGDISVRGVQAAVFPEGKLQVSLLGMSFLSKISKFELDRGRLTLSR